MAFGDRISRCRSRDVAPTSQRLAHIFAARIFEISRGSGRFQPNPRCQTATDLASSTFCLRNRSGKRCGGEAVNGNCFPYNRARLPILEERVSSRSMHIDLVANSDSLLCANGMRGGPSAHWGRVPRANSSRRPTRPGCASGNGAERLV